MTDHLTIAREAKRRVCADGGHRVYDDHDECGCGEIKRTGSWFEEGLKWRKRLHDAAQLAGKAN